MTLVAQIADIHFGAEDPRALDAAASSIAEARPGLVVVCGDLTQRGKRSEFDAAAEWIEALPAPALVVPGNHDTPLLNLADRVSRPFDRFERLFPNWRAPQTAGDVAVIGLNTARGWQARRNWAEGVVDLDTLDERLDAVSTIAPGRSAMLTCHHPFRSPSRSPLRVATRRGRRASRRLAQSAAPLLLTGHVHTPSAEVHREEDGAYLAVAAGTLSTRLRRAPPGFNLIRVENRRVAIDAQEIVDGAIKSRSLGVWRLDDLEPASA